MKIPKPPSPLAVLIVSLLYLVGLAIVSKL